MYEKPRVQRFGTFRQLTQAGCTGMSDGRIWEGAGTAVGDTPRITSGTTDFCFTQRGSR
jgi:hypothetical protein